MNANDEFKEFGGLADRLAKADFTGDSRVKAALRSRLLEKRAESRARGWRAWWLLPAAAVMAAALVVVNIGHKPPAAPGVPGAAYLLPDDGYGACGRQGLGDITAEERF